MSFLFNRIRLAFQANWAAVVTLALVVVAVSAIVAGRPAFGQAAGSDKQGSAKTDAAKTASAKDGSSATDSKPATTSSAKPKLPDPFADEAPETDKRASKTDDKAAKTASDTNAEKAAKPATNPDDPFAETPSKGKFDDKAAAKPAKGPTDPFGDSTSAKTDPSRNGADSEKSSKKSADTAGKNEPALPSGAASKKVSPNVFEDTDASKPDNGKPADMKSDEKKSTDNGSEKQPQKPTDILLDTKSTEPPPSPGQAELDRGKELIEAGKYADAIEPLKKSIKLFPALPSPDSAPAHYQLGIAYRLLNRYDDAIKEFSEALKSDPAIQDAMLRRGICWYYKDEYTLAQADFDEAAGASNNDPRPLTWKGMTLVKLGQVRNAVTAYSEALRFDSRYAPAHVNRGLAYIALHDYAKAVADFDQAIRSTPDDASLFFKRGVAQGALGDFKAAVKSYTEAIRINPKYAAAYSNRSTAYQRLGDTAKAQSDATRSQELKASASRATQSAAR